MHEMNSSCGLRGMEDEPLVEGAAVVGAGPAPVALIAEQLSAIADSDVEVDDFSPPWSSPLKGPREQRVELEQFLQPPGENVAELGGQRLSQTQLEEIWDAGQLSVPSVAFPGQVHEWQLSLLLQKGLRPARETLAANVASSLSLLVVNVPQLLWRQRSGSESINFVACLKRMQWTVVRVPRQLLGALERGKERPSCEEARDALLCERLGLSRETLDALEDDENDTAAAADTQERGLSPVVDVAGFGRCFVRLRCSDEGWPIASNYICSAIWPRVSPETPE